MTRVENEPPAAFTDGSCLCRGNRHRFDDELCKAVCPAALPTGKALPQEHCFCFLSSDRVARSSVIVETPAGKKISNPVVIYFILPVLLQGPDRTSFKEQA